jgi:hypothetical protein
MHTTLVESADKTKHGAFTTCTVSPVSVFFEISILYKDKQTIARSHTMTGFSHNDVCSPVTVVRPAKVRTVDASEFQKSSREVGEGVSRHFNKLRTPIDRQGVPECRKCQRMCR